MSMSPVPCQPREIHLSTSFSNVPRLPPFLKCLQNSHVLFISGGLHHAVLRKNRRGKIYAVYNTPCTCHIKQHVNVPKWSKTVSFWRMVYFEILTWTCASRHNGVHFFDTSAPKSGPTLVYILHFDLEMCFAPQRHALFRHLNFQKLSKHGVFSTFWFPNVFRATMAYNFSSRRLRTNRFSERTFRSSLPFRAPAFFFLICFFCFFVVSLL